MMYGNEYIPSIGALKILIFVIPIIFLSYLSGNLLSVSNKQKYVCNIVMANAIFNIVLNFFLIPKFHMLGASISTVLTELLGLMLMTYYISKNFFKLSARVIINPVFCGSLMVALIYFLKNYIHWIFLGVLSTFVYCIALISMDSQLKKVIMKLVVDRLPKIP